MNFLRVALLGDGALAAEIDAWRCVGHSFLPVGRPVALDNAIHFPWWVSEDKRQIVFARRQGGVIVRLVVFEVADPTFPITASSYASVFTLAAGEGWMCDERRATARVEHVRRAITAAYATF